MKVGIIGTGKMGRGFATALASKHEVIVGSRDEDRATAAASRVGAARGATYADAAADADVAILRVPWEPSSVARIADGPSRTRTSVGS